MDSQIRKNIFIAYTPFHVLLAIGIAYSKKEEQNHLLIVQNFPEVNPLIEAIVSWFGNPFHNVIDFPGEFNLERHSKLRRRWIRYFSIKKCAEDILKYIKKNKLTNFYFFNDERPQSLRVLNYLEKKGSELVYVEDGAVAYSSFVSRKSFHYLLLGKLIFGLWWRDVSVMGLNKKFRRILAVYPEYLRKEFSDKETERIDLKGIFEFGKQDSLEKYLLSFGISSQLLKDINVMILLPHSSILNQKPAFRNLMADLVKKFEENGQSVAVKYHPRDANNDVLDLRRFNNVVIINPAIPIEFIFLRMNKNLNYVVSDLSTTLMSAKWCLDNPKVISLGELMGNKDENFNRVLKSLGVLLPNNISELEESLQS